MQFKSINKSGKKHESENTENCQFMDISLQCGRNWQKIFVNKQFQAPLNIAQNFAFTESLEGPLNTTAAQFSSHYKSWKFSFGQ